MNHITKLNALELAACLHGSELTITETLDAYYAAIEASELNCYITLCKEQAYAQAAEIQQRLDAGDIRSALAGVPIAVKDNICTRDIRTTCASKMLEHFIPPYDATVIEKIQHADMVILGKTNMDEFSMGGTSESSFFGAVKHPRHPDYAPGGSSGGSAAALVAHEAPLALGSDTGGSVRQPASHCGVFGLKPTYGSISRYGLIAYASSMDQIGPMARTAQDCAALFDIISGKDNRDSTSMEYPEKPAQKIQGLRIGIPAEFFAGNLRPDIANAVLALNERLIILGAAAKEFSLPIMNYAAPAYYALASAEASSSLARFDGIKYGHSSESATNLSETYVKSRSEGFGPLVKRRVMLGNLVLSAGNYDTYYKKALHARRLIREAFDAAFQRFDIILTPVAPTTAPKLGEIFDPPNAFQSDAFTCPASVAGLPAISIPCGEDTNGFPIGAQLIGRPFEEATLIGVGGCIN